MSSGSGDSNPSGVLIQRTLNSDEAVLELLKSHEASAVIEALK